MKFREWENGIGQGRRAIRRYSKTGLHEVRGMAKEFEAGLYVHGICSKDFQLVPRKLYFCRMCGDENVAQSRCIAEGYYRTIGWGRGDAQLLEEGVISLDGE
jgi:hypothetical protein